MEEFTSPLKAVYAKKYDDVPRRDVLKLITDAPESVLEVGCGTGATGLSLKEKFQSARVVGLEIDPGAAAIARNRLDTVFTGDIEKTKLEHLGIHKHSFDLIICADVLEHLYDPWRALHSLRTFLKPGGRLIASIPNTQNINLILHLLAGNWTYQEHGLLDATHIRFFTLSEIFNLFSGTGYRVVRCANILQRDIEEGGWPRDLDLGRVVLKGVTREEANMLYTFQYFIVAEPDGSNLGAASS